MATLTTNASGFNAFPAGFGAPVPPTMQFANLGSNAYFWSSNAVDGTAQCFELKKQGAELGFQLLEVEQAASLRCLRG